MATTTLAITNNRRTTEVTLVATVTSVALDAAVNEYFVLPSGFGQLLVLRWRITVGALSGAYVAPAPAFDGVQMSVVSSDTSTLVDILGNGRYVNVSTSSGRPILGVTDQMYERTLIRQFDQVNVAMPILAGGGVTGSITCVLVGNRIMTQ